MRAAWACVALALAALAACGGQQGPVVTLHREITSGQVYGLGFEATTITIERPGSATVSLSFPVTAHLDIKQHGASPARPVESERQLELSGEGCEIEFAGRAGDQSWQWRVVPRRSGPLRLTLDLSGLPGPLKSCQLDGRYVTCDAVRAVDVVVEVD